MFDDPGRFEGHPKDIERARQDSGQAQDHEHMAFHDQMKIPSNWRDMLECRQCKRQLVVYIGDCFLLVASQFLQEWSMR